MQIYSISGNSQKLDGGAMFGNAPKALWQRWYEADEFNRIHLQCRCLLVQHENKNFLFETGVGAFFSPEMKQRYGIQETQHRLTEELSRLGLSPDDIDIIVLSHLHFDHAGGLLSEYREDKLPELLFSNARIVVSQAAWERAAQPHPRDRASFIPELTELLEHSGQLHLVTQAQDSILGENFRFRISDGHTPGMMLTEIRTATDLIIFCADLVPGTAWVNSAITMGYDRFPELLIDEKTALLDYAIAQDATLFFTHDPVHATAKLQRNAKGKFQPTQLATSVTWNN